MGNDSPVVTPSDAAIAAFLDAHRRVMDTDYESSDLPRVAVRAGLGAAYAVDRGAALEAGPSPREPNLSGAIWDRLMLLLGDTWSSAWNEVAMKASNYSDIIRVVGQLRGVRGESLLSDAKIAPRNSGNAVGRVGGEEP